MKPLVSILIPAFNAQEWIADAIRSAIAQTWGRKEIVVVDDGSTDQSHTVYGRFPSVRVVRKSHEGFAATLTRAVRESSGDWIAPLDADDAFTPDKLRTVAPHLADPALLLVQHGEYVVDAAGRPFAEGMNSAECPAWNSTGTSSSAHLVYAGKNR